MKKTLRKIIFVIIIIALVSLSIYVLYKYIFFPKKYNYIIEEASRKYGVDPNLVYAIIKQESKFSEVAISKSKAKGLMQILDSTAKDMSKYIEEIDSKNIDLFDPKTNIFIGTKYISYLLNHFKGNYYLTVAAYNAGLGKVESWVNKDYTKYTELSDFIDSIEYNETKTYVTNVFNYYKYYTLLYN